MKRLKVKDFSKLGKIFEMPDFLEVQLTSYADFLQKDTPPEERKHQGLQAIFSEMFPVKSLDGSLEMSFGHFYFKDYGISPDEALYRKASYHTALWATMFLNYYDVTSGESKLKESKEADVFICNIPLITPTGSFIINGVERVIMNQLHRSPGIIFEEDEENRISVLGKNIFVASVIPYRGIWIEFEFDRNNILFAKIDKKRKIFATALLRALGFEQTIDILKLFTEKIELNGYKSAEELYKELEGGTLVSSPVDTSSGEILTSIIPGEPVKKEWVSEIYAKKKNIGVVYAVTYKKNFAIFDTLKREKMDIYAGRPSIREAAMLDVFKKARYESFNEKQLSTLFFLDDLFAVSVIEKNPGRKQAKNTLPEYEVIESRKYDFSKVGRFKINRKLGSIFQELDENPFKSELQKKLQESVAAQFFERDKRLLEEQFGAAGKNKPEEINKFLNADSREKMRKETARAFCSKYLKIGRPDDKFTRVSVSDIIGAIKYLIRLNSGIDDGFKYNVDDIDHLYNRRVRSVGELLENEMRKAFYQMLKYTKDRINSKDKEEPEDIKENKKSSKVVTRKNLTVKDLISPRAIESNVMKFFMTSSLSQFLDNTNPLAELTNKRRLSALGPGGLNRKRAGFEVRDVHYTHYGRICPIETPEGANIGLIVSLTCYAKVNEYGLVETPYRKVENGKLSPTIEYKPANVEDDAIMSQAYPRDCRSIPEGDILCRLGNDYVMAEPEKINYADISPMQIFSPATALVPFLEHDDANRALMGSNMQRQSVPLLYPQFPIVGTGIEGKIAVDSHSVITAKRDGKVTYVDAETVLIRPEGSKSEPDRYVMKKYQRSNQDTMINFMPTVSEGDSVKKGMPIADGPSTNSGQIALGTNVTVAFMSWQGYNFEDAIIISQRMVKDDTLTSVHIMMFDAEARDTRQGPEEITKDLPNISADMLSNLDERGIIRIGTEVQPNDILVGKVRPKSEKIQTAEDRLISQIFNKKSEEVFDDSLRVPPGMTGKVIDVRVMKRKLSDTELQKEVKKTKDRYDKNIIIMDADFKDDTERTDRELEKSLAELAAGSYKSADGAKATKKSLVSAASKLKADLKKDYQVKKQNMLDKKKKDLEDLKVSGDNLPLNVNEYVRVFIASRRKIQAGDKLAGRHGNKGIIAKILPVEDMPYTADGSPVDILLSPLSVPSRMNVGQIYELMLGWAAGVLGYQAVLPIFDGASEKEVLTEIAEARKKMGDELKEKIKEKFIDAEYGRKSIPDEYLRIQLFDGRTGEAFSNRITVGIMYMMKLVHMVEDKVHARSTGPYSLVTRQPLGGKAQFGGQRMGEMELWAIEGYGAAYILQEFLTIKSDDVSGRLNMYNAIINGDVLTEPSVPESFKVLIKEMQAICINVELLRGKSKK